MNRRTTVLLLGMLFFGSGHIVAQSRTSTSLVKAGRLLDPRTGNILSPVAVLIENGKVKEVGPPSQVQAHAPLDPKTIDLGSATLLPGLIDSHTHLLLDVVIPAEPEIGRPFNGWFVPGLLLGIVESPSKRALIGAQMAREDLERGFTTVRNLGHSMVTSRCETQSKRDASQAQGSWRPDETGAADQERLCPKSQSRASQRHFAAGIFSF